MGINRRNFLKGVAVYTTVMGTGIALSGRDVVKIKIEANTEKRAFVGDWVTEVMAYNNTMPIIRVKQGQALQATLYNYLKENTTIHWHGLRLPNKMDGVPILTQPSVPNRGHFVYEFDCKDAGTFWFHTHVNSKRQMGRGMVGVLIVEDETHDTYDRDIVWGYHDLHLNKMGEPISDDLSLMSDRMSAMMGGVYGNFATVNGKPIADNVEQVPAGSWIRLRFLNMDNSRLMTLALVDEKGKEYREAKIIALDGNALSTSAQFVKHEMGPANRVDVAIKMPKTVGKKLFLKNIALDNPSTIGMVETVVLDTPLTPKPKFFPHMPKMNPITMPDLGKAEVIDFRFHNMVVQNINDIKSPLWGINDKSWMETNRKENALKYPDPLQKLKLGGHYIFRIVNESAFSHPIHMHGHTWWFVASNLDRQTGYHSDTILLKPTEVIEVAFVADNLGGWMYHCHIIDHMISGMMGWIQVGDSDDIAKILELSTDELLGLGGTC